jgi:hypothetical protein
MSFAIGFFCFREEEVKVDTIPKPVGLGSARASAPCLHQASIKVPPSINRVFVK